MVRGYALPQRQCHLSRWGSQLLVPCSRRNFPRTGAGFVCRGDPDFFSGRTGILHARLGRMIGDEAALKQMLSVKGASGTIPCLKCWNVVAASSELHLHDATGTLVPHTCFDTSKFKLRTDEQMLSSARHLQSEHAVRSASTATSLLCGWKLVFVDFQHDTPKHVWHACEFDA